ncbi:lysophospholipid acyltransferase family protein [Cerasicoccus fimbriatus]|uniref:lysophospholipid acyltransferase family protein n=1 Tax=Cerasicoccus fimbriatus TaxID=3014554 RepID=UPI0022B53725|nr:lysophospholipid acyltransferase family protein [Cerasicoccus sp. TK19100]
MPSESPKPLIDVRESLSGWQLKLYELGGKPLNDFLGISALNMYYQRVVDDHSTINFYERALRSLNVAYEVSEEDLAKIPREGPTLVVSNHPFGMVDGVVFGALLTSLRDDAKLLANYLLTKMSEIQPWMIAVDPFGGPEAARSNFAALKETMRHIKDGGCIGTFPSGTVSHWQWKTRQITDPLWLDNTARIIHKSQPTVVPLYFEGRNSLAFQIAGMVHPLLRTASLTRELSRQANSVVRLRIGQPLTYRQLKDFPSHQALMDFLRLKTYLLAKREGEEKPRRFSFPRLPKRETPMKEVDPSTAPEVLAAEIDGLPEDRLLTEHGDFKVYWAHAEEIPEVLEELGRLRERTFRVVGEGTGESTDLDRYDLHYRHLFMWDAKAQAIVGSYRIGLVDEILLTRGRQGLYTASLFNFKQEFFEKLGPALEVGRSFIAVDYQKKHASLSMIWRGLGLFVVRHPQYRTLFGPVSISQEYNAVSKDLMVKFLKKNKLHHELANYVSAKHPPRGKKLGASENQAMLSSVRSIDDVSALISEIEIDQKGVPVLLKHYLKLNGTLLSFNVDPDFGNCLDGLILVDFTKSDQRLLKNYLTPEGLRSFLEYHSVEALI